MPPPLERLLEQYSFCALRREVRAARRLGQYELNRKIGEGGMGIVYEATHVMLRRPTALKLLPVERAGEETVSRFEREVRLTSRLEHPNSVYIFDYGRTPDGQFYYAMEYLDGFDLKDLVEHEGPLGDARTCLILRQAAHALAEAHCHGPCPSGHQALEHHALHSRAGSRHGEGARLRSGEGGG